MINKKTIFITAFHSFISKNIINTDNFLSLPTNHPEYRFVLLVSVGKEEFYRQTYPQFTIQGVDVNKITNQKSSIFFSRLSYLLVDSHYLKYKKYERFGTAVGWWKYIKLFFEITFTKLFADRRSSRFIYRYLFTRLGHVRDIDLIFDQYQPSYLFSTDVFDESDVLFSKKAQSLGLSILGMVRSWDNCFSKGVMRVLPDKLLVNNETIKDEATFLHDVSTKRIEVVGLPQFDHFIKNSRTGREEFFTSLGLNSDRKLVVFAPAGKILSDTDSQILDILNRGLKESRFIEPISVLVRNHPNHPADFSSLELDSRIKIENPGLVFNPNNPKETELTKSDSVHLADTLFYADIVIFIATTLGIDALVFNKPEIVIDFDGYDNKRDYWHSVRRYHDEDHMKKMISCGGWQKILAI